MDRREVLKAVSALPLACMGGAAGSALAATQARRAPVTGAASPAAVPATQAFSDDTVPALARALAAAPWQPPLAPLPAALASINYDQYRDYRFRPAKALWREDALPFQAQFYHRGFLFKDRVDLHTVSAARATPLPFSTSLFDYGPQPVPAVDDIGFAGFRVHAPLNRADYFDELCSFLGASYFRAVAAGLQYGLSARALALGSGDPGPEEFPRFTAFWLERPAADSRVLVVHALMDSRSVAGAYRFAITPGRGSDADTVFEVDARLYPRVALANAGIAPLTSMFQFDASDRTGIDDYRPAVHDSDGLSMLNARGEALWRQLSNPRTIQHSGFLDGTPRGFGLLQRKRAAADFLDGEAHYERRPSAWVEPIGDWGRGEVHLVEIPTADEYQDNIVAFWRPAAPLAAGREHRFRYRLHWCADHVWVPTLATVASTRVGAAPRAPQARLVVLTLRGGRLAGLAEDAAPRIDASASAGTLRNAVARRAPDGASWQLSFELVPEAATSSELRVALADAAGPLTETFLYRWTA